MQEAPVLDNQQVLGRLQLWLPAAYFQGFSPAAMRLPLGRTMERALMVLLLKRVLYFTAAAARDGTFRLLNNPDTWMRTVNGEISRALAISLLVLPWAISRNTSCWRAVRVLVSRGNSPEGRT